MRNSEEQVAKGWVIVAIAALTVALAVIFFQGCSSKAQVVEAPKMALVSCDTDLDCQLKNPQIDPDGFMDSEE